MISLPFKLSFQKKTVIQKKVTPINSRIQLSQNQLDHDQL